MEATNDMIYNRFAIEELKKIKSDDVYLKAAVKRAVEVLDGSCKGTGDGRVEMCRCGDCRHWVVDDDLDSLVWRDGYCTYLDVETGENFYCAFGKSGRKEK